MMTNVYLNQSYLIPYSNMINKEFFSKYYTNVVKSQPNHTAAARDIVYEEKLIFSGSFAVIEVTRGFSFI